MTPYPNADGRSNVAAYDIAPDERSIAVRFTDGTAYLYTVASCGPAYLENMIRLARAGRGLGGYITQVVRKGYERKW